MYAAMESPSLSLKDKGRIYLDHNATTPPLSVVLEEIPGWVRLWGNPSSIHWSGRGPKNLIRQTRQAIAKTLRVHPHEVFFTSGGSEGNNQIIKGVFRQFRNSPRDEYITTRVEHPSVLKSFQFLEAEGAKVHYIDVNRDGRLDLESYQNILSEKTALVSVMFANNETGSKFPIEKLSGLARDKGALFHSDAVQSLGKEEIDLSQLPVDFATFSGHKVYSLKGVGFIYVKRGRQVPSLISGGGQERGRRAGTENVLAVASLGHVFRTNPVFAVHQNRMKSLRDELEQLIRQKIDRVQFTGAQVPRIANTSSLVIEDVDGESLLMNLDLAGASVSTGAACSSGNPEPSPTLLAMGLNRYEAQSSLRLSLGWGTTRDEILRFVKILEEVVSRLRSFREQERAGRSKSASFG